MDTDQQIILGNITALVSRELGKGWARQGQQVLQRPRTLRTRNSDQQNLMIVDVAAPGWRVLHMSQPAADRTGACTVERLQVDRNTDQASYRLGRLPCTSWMSHGQNTLKHHVLRLAIARQSMVLQTTNKTLPAGSFMCTACWLQASCAGAKGIARLCGRYLPWKTSW